MAKNNNVAVALSLVAVVIAAVLLAEAPASEAATCSAVALSPCAPAIMSNQAPTSACCAKLKEQKPCLCQYLKNPTLKPYVNSPGAKRVASTCKVSVSC